MRQSQGIAGLKNYDDDVLIFIGHEARNILCDIPTLTYTLVKRVQTQKGEKGIVLRAAANLMGLKRLLHQNLTE